MSQNVRNALNYTRDLLAHESKESFRQKLQKKDIPVPPRVPGASLTDATAVDKRWKLISKAAAHRDVIHDSFSAANHEKFSHNVENFIGTVKIPLGLAGPLRVNGLHAQGDYYIPLATTEAALVASYSRGAMVITEAGGCSTLVISEGVSRSPGFAFETVIEAAEFATWVLDQTEAFKSVTKTTTQHGELIDFRLHVEGNHVYLIFDYTTGDASGQNMVTIATQAICTFIEEKSPVSPKYYFVEANFSGDKKASHQSFLTVRGKKVTAEIFVPASLVEKRLHTTPEKMVQYYRLSSLGGVMSGAIGIQGHYANGLAALFLACGQDVACIAEVAVGITRFELTENGDLYASVTLPNMIVGTVGGGTGLPSQAACLQMLGLQGTGQARAFAEVAAGLALAGELSIIGALSAQQFTQAHQRLARGKK